jgi:hypothetical protein
MKTLPIKYLAIATAALFLAACGNDVQTAQAKTSDVTPTLSAVDVTASKPSISERSQKDWIVDASQDFDLLLNLGLCGGVKNSDDPNKCSGAGSVVLKNKDSAEPFQTISLSNIEGYKDSPVRNQSKSFGNKDQHNQTVELGDFNSDGHDDIAIWSGNQGGYGGSSYHVYLFDKEVNKMLFNKPLSALTVGALGIFKLTDGRITSYEKSGCCEHYSTTYHFVNGALMPVEKTSEVLSPNDSNVLIVTTKKFNSGRWSTVSTEQKPVE